MWLPCSTVSSSSSSVSHFINDLLHTMSDDSLKLWNDMALQEMDLTPVHSSILQSVLTIYCSILLGLLAFLLLMRTVKQVVLEMSDIRSKQQQV